MNFSPVVLTGAGTSGTRRHHSALSPCPNRQKQPDDTEERQSGAEGGHQGRTRG